jgi:hypothetical protein
LATEDADYIAREFQPVSPRKLTELANHHVYLKLTVKGVTSDPFSGRTLSPPPPLAISYRGDIVRRSRRFYARPRALVERRNLTDSRAALR